MILFAVQEFFWYNYDETFGAYFQASRNDSVRLALLFDYDIVDSWSLRAETSCRAVTTASATRGGGNLGWAKHFGSEVSEKNTPRKGLG